MNSYISTIKAQQELKSDCIYILLYSLVHVLIDTHIYCTLSLLCHATIMGYKEVAKLSMDVQHLIGSAISAQTAGYAPYSHFKVGAALLHSDGRTITTGCNYENCTFQACCAERCAIVRANVEGRRTAKAIAIFGKSMQPTDVPREEPANASSNSSSGINTPCYPCGLCRQLLLEVAQLSNNYDDFEIFCITTDAQHVDIVKLADLLPHAFGPKNINIDLSQYAQGQK